MIESDTGKSGEGRKIEKAVPRSSKREAKMGKGWGGFLLQNSEVDGGLVGFVCAA